MKKKALSFLSVRSFLTRGALLFPLVLPLCLRASESSVLEQLHEALEPSPTVWGGVNIGRTSRIEPDANGIATAQRIGELIRQRMQGPAPAAIHAAGNVVSAQVDAIQRLKAQTGAKAEVLLRPGNGT